MKLKVSKTNLIEVGIIIVFLLDICFWFIFPINTSFVGVNNKKLLTIISLLLTITVIFTSKEFKQNRFRFLNIFCFAYLIELGVLTLYSMKEYPVQGLSGTLSMTYYFFVLLIVYPLIYVIERKGIERVINSIGVIAAILIVVVFLQGIIYAFSGTIFMKGAINTESLLFRNGRIRIGLTNLGNIFVLYYFAEVFKKKKKVPIAAIILFTIGIVDVFFIQMTRMASLAVIGALLVIYVVAQKKSARFIRIVLIAFVIVYVVFGLNLVDYFIQSFDIAGEYGSGTRIRLEAVRYFWSYVENNPIFGMGLVDQNSYYSVLYGTAGRYYLSDVGIVGLIAQGGWSMAAFYILFITRMIYILHKTKTDKSNEMRPFLFGIITFTILCTPSLIIWSRRTMLYISFIMACFEYYYMSFTDEKRRMVNG